MKNLINSLLFLSCLLPVAASARQCLNEQGPPPMEKYLSNPKPSWICPGGKFVIELTSANNVAFDEYVNLKVKNIRTIPLKLRMEKYDPRPKQIQLLDNNYNTTSREIEIVQDNIEAGSYPFPKLITGNVTANGIKRTITITNESEGELCFSGFDPNGKKGETYSCD